MLLGRSASRLLIGAAIVASVAHSPRTSRDFETRERIRVQAHFDSVLAELRARGVADLPATSRANRAQLISTLESYSDRGLFPHNYDFPDQLVPTFIDPKTGVRCAVAQLVESTGRADLAARVAATNNHVHVIELAGDTAFASWLATNGLTFAEAVRIQPSYGRERFAEEPLRKYDFTAFMLAAGSAGVATTNIVADRSRPHYVLGSLGIVTGMIAMASGLQFMESELAGDGVSKAAVGMGALSTVMGMNRMMPRAPDPIRAVSVSPTVSLAAPQSSARVGFAGRIRF